MRHAFLRFVTGSSTCSSNCLLIVFNSEEGMARRPIAHTCGFTLEVSTHYDSYYDFDGEFFFRVLKSYCSRKQTVVEVSASQ